MIHDNTHEAGRINLKEMKWVKDSLLTSGLALANIIDQPIFEDNIIHVKFCYAADLIKNMHQAINCWLDDYFEIEEALEDYNDMLSFMAKKGCREEFRNYQSQIKSQQDQKLI